MKDIYSDTQAEKINMRTVVYLDLINKADKKTKELKKSFVNDYYNKELLMNAFIKYERIISYLFERWDREYKKPGNA